MKQVMRLTYEQLISKQSDASTNRTDTHWYWTRLPINVLIPFGPDGKQSCIWCNNNKQLKDFFILAHLFRMDLMKITFMRRCRFAQQKIEMKNAKKLFNSISSETQRIVVSDWNTVERHDDKFMQKILSERENTRPRVTRLHYQLWLRWHSIIGTMLNQSQAARSAYTSIKMSIS